MKHWGHLTDLDLVIPLPCKSQNSSVIHLHGRFVRAGQAFPKRLRQQGALPRR